jgi:hypothetical protein
MSFHTKLQFGDETDIVSTLLLPSILVKIEIGI